jgi:hypothetical protein
MFGLISRALAILKGDYGDPLKDDAQAAMDAIGAQAVTSQTDNQCVLDYVSQSHPHDGHLLSLVTQVQTDISALLDSGRPRTL